MTELDQRLPPALARVLSPQRRRALDSSRRRQIIRVLNAATEPRSLKELALAVPGSGLSSVSYHLAVLEQCGCLVVSEDPAGLPCCSRRFASGLLGVAGVAEALEATRELDRPPA